jgi:uncharacterized protein (TIGR02001 family)
MLSRLNNNTFLLILCISLSAFLSGEEALLPAQELEKKESASLKKEDLSDEKKDSAPLPYTLSGTLTFVSDYRSRGISQTMREPAVQGEFTCVHQSGLYVKTWASNVDGTGNFIGNSSMEWDFYLGFKQRVANTAFKYDIGFEYYWYPGGEARVPKRIKYNTVEYYVGITYKNFGIKITQTLTDYFGFNSDNPPINWDKKRTLRPNGHSYFSPYLEANYAWTINTKWSASCHIAYQGMTNYPDLGYIDWNVVVTRKFDWFTLSLAYIQTNAKKAFYNVPDNAFKPHRKWLAGPTAVLSVYHTF